MLMKQVEHGVNIGAKYGISIAGAHLAPGIPSVPHVRVAPAPKDLPVNPKTGATLAGAHLPTSVHVFDSPMAAPQTVAGKPQVYQGIPAIVPKYSGTSNFNWTMILAVVGVILAGFGVYYQRKAM